MLVAVVLAAASLLLQSVLSPFQAAFTELINGVCARRLMRAALADAPVALLEQPEVLDKLGDARRGLVEYFATPGAAVAGLLARWSVIIERMSPARRKAYYILDTGSELAAAKEIRVLGTLSWWRARADQDSGAFLRPLCWSCSGTPPTVAGTACSPTIRCGSTSC